MRVVFFALASCVIYHTHWTHTHTLHTHLPHYYHRGSFDFGVWSASYPPYTHHTHTLPGGSGSLVGCLLYFAFVCTPRVRPHKILIPTPPPDPTYTPATHRAPTHHGIFTDRCTFAPAFWTFYAPFWWRIVSFADRFHPASSFSHHFTLRLEHFAYFRRCHRFGVFFALRLFPHHHTLQPHTIFVGRLRLFTHAHHRTTHRTCLRFIPHHTPTPPPPPHAIVRCRRLLRPFVHRGHSPPPPRR